MSQTAQRVVVIQDASRDISLSVLNWALQGLSLEPGDKLTLLGVLHQVNTPSTFPYMGAKTLLGYMSRVDSSSIFGANPRILKEAVSKKKEEYDSSMEIQQIHKLYEMHKIEFNVSIVLASSLKTAAVQAAQTLQATWIIIDRQMKKDKKYFLEKLSCGISRMKRDKSVVQLRGPKTSESNTMHTVGSWSSFVTYDEMIPGTPDDEDLFSLELSPKKCRSPHKTSSNEEPRTDRGKGPSRNSARMPSFPKSISSEHLNLVNKISSANRKKHEASSLSSSLEVKHSPDRLQEEENCRNLKIEVPDDGSPDKVFDNIKLGQVEHDEIMKHDTGQIDRISNYGKVFLTFGHAEVQPQERIEKSTCSDCQNNRPMTGEMRDFTYAELLAATDNFSFKNFLSEGGFGHVYKGKLRDGRKIAVKQHKNASLQGETEFKREVHVLSKARHENVVKLLGSCSERNHRLLVYEYICNGSLDKHLSEDNHRPLSWKDRMRLALGIAKGLNYLHEHNIIHRDMRPNNILVTHDYDALLGDFGLARTQHEGPDHSSETRVVGTFGYLAPEYAEYGKVSKKTDVYSFGVVLLELISGWRTTDKKLGEKSLVGWARPLLKERKYPDLIDSRILDSHDVHQLFWMVSVAEMCLSKDPDKRPSMEEVVHIIKEKCVSDEGTVSKIEDFSLAHSDSVYSLIEENESQGDIGTLAKLRVNTEASPISSRNMGSEVFSSASSTKTFSTVTTNTSASLESSSSGRKSIRKKRAKSGSQSQIRYGEMLC